MTRYSRRLRVLRACLPAAALLLLAPASTAQGDVLLTTSGRRIVCVIERETDGRVDFVTERGDGSVPQRAIQEISRATAEENAQLRAQWAGPAAAAPEDIIETTPVPPAPRSEDVPHRERDRIPWTKAGPSDDPTAQTDLDAKFEPVYEDNFVEVVLKADRPVLVAFMATWCYACRLQEPILEQLAFELEGKMQIVRLDVDVNPRVARHFGVRTLPTMIIFDEGRKQSVIVGYQTSNRLRPIVNASVIKGGPDNRHRW